MTTIYYRGLEDFIKCPLQYKYRYVDKLKTEEHDEGYKEKDAIENTIITFYRVFKEKERVLTYNELKTIFSQFYIEEDPDDILLNKQSKAADRSDFSKPLKYLKNFHNYYSGWPGELIYNQQKKFKIKLGDIIIRGRIPFIRKREGRREIFNVYINEERPVTKHIHEKYIFFAIMSMAYRSQYKKEEDRIVFYDGFSKKHMTKYVKDKDIKKSLTEIENIASIINNENFYKNPGSHCKDCTYQWYCNRRINTTLEWSDSN